MLAEAVFDAPVPHVLVTEAAVEGRERLGYWGRDGRADVERRILEDDGDGGEHHVEVPGYFMKGAYGTQRQTILLCDWDGNVTYTERALWDAHGNLIERGKGDVVHRFKVPAAGEEASS